jgi:hypothetical protein
MSSSSLRRLQIASRVGAGLVGGWLFVWGFVALSTAAQLRAGVPYGDALTLAYLLAFLLFLVVFLWAFAAARVTRVWAVLAGGGALMTGLAWLLAR